ncbi:hypothetical protein [Chitinophaga solisilvae]|uniref:hypothetical protein n=1 Tax=Chitinophaga solisilvae TaxID=1233460 RepID=UPI00136AC8B0|nr:hypothetical protein [Chitinophaga solisilvae]
MLIGITNPDEIAACISSFKSIMTHYADVQIPIMYSSRANTRPELIANFSRKHNLWWSIEKRGNKYWNIFGRGKPHKNKTNRGRCQINVPVRGFSKQIRGGFAKDSNGNVYLLHNGGVGGGMLGISRSGFVRWYSDTREEIIYDEQVELFYVVGELTSPNFIEQLNFFIEKVYEFKEGDPTDVQNELNMLEAGESLLRSPYTMPERIVFRGVNHAIVVNELLNQLRVHKVSAYRNRFMDTFIINKQGVCTHIFEVKCKLTTQSLYTGIGQLLIYGLNYPRAKRYLLIEEEYVEEIHKDLERLNINCISYKWKRKKPEIQLVHVLDDIIPVTKR